MQPRKTLLMISVATVLIAGCSKPQPESETVSTSPSSTEVAESLPAVSTPADAAVSQPAQADAAAAVAFDMTKIPVSDKPLDAFPYLAPPAGYVLENTETKDLARVPFWTGRALEFVEGKVHQARIDADGEKSYSRFEVLKRVDEALTALGAVRVTQSEVPEELLEKELPKDFGVEFNAGAGGYYGGQEVSTYVLRRADKAVWFKVYSDTNSGSLLVAETEAAPPI